MQILARLFRAAPVKTETRTSCGYEVSFLYPLDDRFLCDSRSTMEIVTLSFALNGHIAPPRAGAFRPNSAWEREGELPLQAKYFSG